MTNKITLYNTYFNPERNMEVEGIQELLDNFLGHEINDIQLIPIDLETKIVIEWNYENIDDFTYNYASYLYCNKHYYYFITSWKWKSANSIELSLKLDTINTYQDKIKFTEKTKIIREHQDRYYHSTVYNENYRKIQRFNETEGINLYINHKEEITKPNTNMDFYLIYKSNANPESAKVNPISCFLAPSESILIKEGYNYGTKTFLASEFKSRYIGSLTQGGNVSFTPFRSENIHIRIWYDKGGGGGGHGEDSKEFYLGSNSILVFEFGESLIEPFVKIVWFKYNSISQTYEYDHTEDQPLGWGDGGEVRTMKRIEIYRSDDVGIFYGTQDVSTNYYDYLTTEQDDCVSGKVPNTILNSIESINRSDPKNIKIIKLPYAPDNISIENDKIIYNRSTWNYDLVSGLLELVDLNKGFEKTYIAGHENPIRLDDILNGPNFIDPENERNDKYESKRYHSNFFKYEFIYDSFTKDIKLENLIDKFNIKVGFKVTNTINSNFIFDFELNESSYYSPDAFEGYMVVKRNNEIPIYNSSYTNYINNGYNYDRKNADRNKTMSWINTGLSLGGSVLSMFGGDFGFASGVGLATSGLQSIASNIANQNRAEQDINQKLHGHLNTAASVSGSDDIDLLDYYSGNRLIRVEATPSEEMMKCWLDMFYYYGYYYPVQEKPNRNTRYWFNFLQCEAEFDSNSYKIPTNFLEDIKERFREGVTLYHKHYDVGGRPIYDFTQTKENAEVWIV